MALPELEPSVIALIGSIFGGVGLKLIESWLGKNRQRNTEAREMRAELWQRITFMKEEITVLENEVDEWKQKYYNLRDDTTELNTQYTILMSDLKRQVDEEK